MLCSALSLPLLNVTLCKQLGCLSIKFPSYVCLSNVCLSNLCLFNLSLSHLCPSYVCLSCKWVASPVCAPASAQLVVTSPPSHGSQTHSPANTNPHLLIAASLQIPSPLIAGWHHLQVLPTSPDTQTGRQHASQLQSSFDAFGQILATAWVDVVTSPPQLVPTHLTRLTQTLFTWIVTFSTSPLPGAGTWFSKYVSHIWAGCSFWSLSQLTHQPDLILLLTWLSFT